MVPSEHHGPQITVPVTSYFVYDVVILMQQGKMLFHR